MRGDEGKGKGLSRTRMPLEDRAKIFVPFDPLDGFREALRRVEAEVEAAAEDEHGDASPAEPND